MTYRLALSAIVLATLPFPATAAWAANDEDPREVGGEAGGETAGAGDAGDYADTIVVTGQAERGGGEISAGALGTRTSLDTPFSLSAATADDIEKLRAFTTADYFVADASVSRDGGSRYNIHAQWVTVRGAAVRTHLYNGVPLRDSQGADTPPEFLEQVQLLKGAGGFIYGFAAPGGIINYVTKQPTENQLQDFSFGYQSGSQFRQHVDVGNTHGPVGYRVNLVQEFGDTYAGSNVLRQGAAVSLALKISEQLTWRGDAFYQHNRINLAEPSWVVGGNAAPFVPSYQDRNVPAPVSGRTRFASDDTYTDGRLHSATTSLTWQFDPDWHARVSAGTVGSNHRLPYERILLINQQGDYALRLFNGLNIYKNNMISFYAEGKFETGGLSHQLSVGADWRDSEGRHGQNLATVQPGGNIFNPVPATWTFDNRRHLEAHKTGWNEEKSAYVSDTVTLFDKLSVLAGLRYTSYKSKSWNWLSQAVTSDYRTDGFTPTFALLFKPDPGTTIYASYIQALAEGTIVGDVYANKGEILPALTSKQYEIGAKWQRADWDATVALFRLDRGANLITDDNRLVQDGVERYQGLEVAGRYRVNPAWSFGLSGVYVDGTHQKAANSWLIGRPLHGTAKFSGVADVSVSPAFLEGLSLRGLLRYQGKAAIYNNQAKNWTVYTPDVLLATAGGEYAFELGGRELTLRGQIQNLFDTRYWNSGTSTCCYSLSPGQPRTISLDLKISL